MTDRCAAGERCSAFNHRERVAAEVDLGQLLCEADLVAGGWAVSALVLDYRDLEQHLPPSLGVWGDGQPRGSGELRVPMRLAVEELQAEIHWIMTTWEEVVRERERLSDSVTKGVRAGWAVQEAAKILQPRIRLLQHVAAQEVWCYPTQRDREDNLMWGNSRGWSQVTGAEGVVDLIRLHRQAQRLLGLTAAKPEVCQGIVCKECDLVNVLCREPGSDDVLCSACKRRYTASEYRAWIRLLEASVRRSA